MATPSNVPPALASRLSRADLFAVIAATEAAREAALDAHHLTGAGITLGATVGGMREAERTMLGPTRMDYPATIATVRAVARYVGDVLAQS